MTTNKERIENLESSVGSLQDRFTRLELGFGEKLQRLEVAISKLTEAAESQPAIKFTQAFDRSGYSSSNSGRGQAEGERPMFSSKLTRLEFPKFAGDDPTEWLHKAEKFFRFQSTTKSQKVPLASFHLEKEADQWWQWMYRTYQEEGKEVTWSIFVEELWSRFGPTDCEDFDESLSRIRQTGSLRDYQREFERLGNRVQGWT